MDTEISRAVYHEIMINVLIPILSAVAVLIANKVRLWLDAKTKQIEDEQVRKALEFAMERLDATVTTVVAEIGQTMVKRDENNKVIDPQKMLETAMLRIKERMSKQTLETLNKAYGNKLSEVVTGKVESKVGSCFS